jgi:hypothetical protein
MPFVNKIKMENRYTYLRQCCELGHEAGEDLAEQALRKLLRLQVGVRPLERLRMTGQQRLSDKNVAISMRVGGFESLCKDPQPHQFMEACM